MVKDMVLFPYLRLERASIVGCVLLACLTLVTPLSTANAAPAKHTVRSGQTLGSIAKRYRLSVKNLAAANNLREDSILRIGTRLKLPKPWEVYVYPGQTLGVIAKANRTSIKALAKKNGLKTNAVLQVGQRLLLPRKKQSTTKRTYTRTQDRVRSGNKWLRPDAYGMAHFERPALGESLHVQLLDGRGEVIPSARAKLSALSRDRKSEQSRPMDEALIRTLANISYHFSGRKIILVNAYRAPGKHSQQDSRHAQAKAVDFRIEGVPNAELRDFCRTLDDVGVGYYPHGTFIHLDVRESSVYWVDWSKPGEASSFSDTAKKSAPPSKKARPKRSAAKADAADLDSSLE